MQTFSPAAGPAPQGAAISIGNFDGLHRGHQVILRQLRDAARERNVPAGLVTFEPSPLVVLNREFPYILTPLEEKQRRLATLGLDFLYVIPFDDKLRRTSAARFMEEMVLSVLRPTLVVVGPDHRFGSDRLGDARFMAGLQERYRFRLEVVPEFRQEGAPVKSTRIRERLILGAVRPAAELLGYRYCVGGTIRPGRGVGTELGFPTANLAVEPPEKLIPPSGVYAGFARLGSATGPPVNCPAGANRHNTDGHGTEAGRWPAEDRHPCAINIGFRPTFDGQYQTIEAHLLDTTPGPLNDRAMTLEFVERLRPEQKFPSVDALKVQIAADLTLARLVLAGA